MKRNELQKARKQTEQTQKQVAKSIGITEQHYKMIENGTRDPSIEIAKKIANHLGVNSINIF